MISKSSADPGMAVDGLPLARYVCQAYNEAEAGPFALDSPRHHLWRDGVTHAFKFLTDAGNAGTLEALV